MTLSASQVGEPLKIWTDEQVDVLVTAIEAEKAAAEAAGGAPAAAPAST